MNDKTFNNYQKRMLDAMQNPNIQSDDPFTKLSDILENLKTFVLNNAFSQVKFKQETEKQFRSILPLDDTSDYIKKTLMSFCSSKNETLKTLSELHNMIKPISIHVSSWSAVASIANECMAEIEQSIFNVK